MESCIHSATFFLNQLPDNQRCFGIDRITIRCKRSVLAIWNVKDAWRLLSSVKWQPGAGSSLSEVTHSGLVLGIGALLFTAGALRLGYSVSHRVWRGGTICPFTLNDGGEGGVEALPARDIPVADVGELPRGGPHPLLRYWHLLTEALRDGVHKSAGRVLTMNEKALSDILRSPFDLGESALNEEVLVLPDIGCFCANTVGLATARQVEGREYLADSPWVVLYAIWTDSLRYTVDAIEVRQRLLSSSAELPQGRLDGCSDVHIPLFMAGAGLAVLWHLANLRVVYEALLVHRDVEMCEEELEELSTHGQEIYWRYIAPWEGLINGKPKVVIVHMSKMGTSTCGVSQDLMQPDSVVLVCYPAGCWAALAAAHNVLVRTHRCLVYRSVWSLGRYLYAASTYKCTSLVMLTLLTGLTARVDGAGTSVKELICTTLSRCADDDCIGSSDNRGSLQRLHVKCMSEVALLCGFFVVQQFVKGVLSYTTNQLVRHTSALRRETVKARLYSALTHIPMTYFDTHSYDKVEEIVYYVNDLEGVDVHVHDYVLAVIVAGLAMRATLSPLSREARVLILGTAFVGNALKALRSLVKDYVRRSLRSRDLSWLSFFAEHTHAVDAEEGENCLSGVQRDGIMLRGLEIIGAIPQLRPYGADVSLMKWWTQHSYHSRVNGRYNLDSSIQSKLMAWGCQGMRQYLPALSSAFGTVVDWFLPTVVSLYGASMAQKGVETPAIATARFLGAVSAATRFVDMLLDAQRVVEVVQRNAYKASVLERLLDPEQWESTNGYLDLPCQGGGQRDTRDTHVNSEVDAPQRSRDLTSPSPDLFTDKIVHAVTITELQFRYPSSPTVNVFTAPFSKTFTLQDPHTGMGRFVCVTGKSGCGKSTLLALLLGLYTHYAADYPDGSICLTLRTETQQLMDNGTTGSSVIRPLPTTVSVDIRSVPCGILRGHLFSYVPQSASLFPGATVAHNVSLEARVSLAEEDILSRVTQCTLEAQCDFIPHLPQGLMTPISDASSLWSSGAEASAGDRRNLVRLSGGQAQRLMLARALYHRGGVLLMDEPTASVDGQTKQKLLRQWRCLLTTGVVKGIICISHDTDVMAEADEIVTIP